MKLVALLRGITVGGHKKIKMADLRALFRELVFGDMQTCIQSGNVVFDPAGADEAEAMDPPPNRRGPSETPPRSSKYPS